MSRANRSTCLLHPGYHGLRRRELCGVALGAVALASLGACAGPMPPARPWEARLGGTSVALLGEVHDNAELHRARHAALRRAFAAGWRPAVVMEQFDTDRQADIERSLRERPLDAAQLIARAGAAGGWNWAHYEPLISLVLEHGLPLLAGNLPRALAARLVRDDAAAVLGLERARALGLDAAPDAAWQAAQEREIHLGHCGALPGSAVPGMARAQFARDAVMAMLLREHAVAQGAVLLAGTGHVRRDIGVPRWLGSLAPQRLVSVGFIESDTAPPAPEQFDAVVIAAPAPRADPCEAFKARPPRSAG